MLWFLTDILDAYYITASCSKKILITFYALLSFFLCPFSAPPYSQHKIFFLFLKKLFKLFWSERNACWLGAELQTKALALQQVFPSSIPQALLECSGLGMRLGSSDFSILPPQVTALGAPTTDPVAKQNKLDFECFYALCPNSLWASPSTQTTPQLRGQGWLQGSAGFGLEGEAFKAANECRVPHGFLRLNFFPPCPWTRKAGQGITIPWV